jgi:3-hydroxyisobutyrate dehydrogenase-like beta-hydroxyacid dehydrogenase
VIEALAPGSIYVDMTVDPATSRGSGLRLPSPRRGVCGAPVTGSKLAAATGELVLMVGGDDGGPAGDGVLRRWQARGSPGAGGVGAMMKLVNNLAIAGSIATLVEALTLGRRAG